MEYTSGLPSVAEGRMAIFMLELGGDVTADIYRRVMEREIGCGDGSGVTADDFVGSCPSGW